MINYYQMLTILFYDTTGTFVNKQRHIRYRYEIRSRVLQRPCKESLKSPAQALFRTSSKRTTFQAQVDQFVPRCIHQAQRTDSMFQVAKDCEVSSAIGKREIAGNKEDGGVVTS